MNLLPVLRQRYFTTNGAPLAGGKLYSYQAGTSTPQATYTDESGITPNANPVILDANGEADVWVDPQLSYKFVLKDSNDVVQWTKDSVIGLASTDAIVTASIQDGAVTTAKIADNGVTSAKLSSSASTDSLRAVTTDHIRDAAVTTSKLPDGSVTNAKRAALGQQISTGSASYSDSAGTGMTDVTNLSVSITTSGRPVWVGLIADATAATAGNPAYVEVASNVFPSSSARSKFQFMRNTTSLGEMESYMVADSSGSDTLRLPPGVLWTIDTPSAGTYTYKLQDQRASSNVVNIFRCKLVAYEL